MQLKARRGLANTHVIEQAGRAIMQTWSRLAVKNRTIAAQRRLQIDNAIWHFFEQQITKHILQDQE